MTHDGPRCLACGSIDVSLWARARDVEYKSVADTFAYHRCAACEALSIHPVPRDRLAEIYPPSYYSFADARPGFVDRVKAGLDRRRFRRLLRDLPGERLSVLDIGGGTGHQLDVLKSADPRITRTTIVDIDAAAASTAMKSGHQFRRGRIEDVELNVKFDVILMLNLIEHVADPVAVLRKARDLLTPTGVILIQTPNYDSLDARLFRHRDWGGLHCPRHWVLFTPSSFRRVVKEAGLETQRFVYTQGAPFWAVSVLAALDRAGVAQITRDRPAWRHPLYPPLAAVFATFDFARGPVMPLSQIVAVLGHPLS